MNRPPQPSTGGAAAGNDAFDALLQLLLDERRDPLDDPRVVAWLDANPERLAAFAALRADLQRLGAHPQPPAVQAPTVSRRAPLLAVAGALAAALWLVFALRDPTTPVQPATPHRQAEKRSPGRILNAHLEGAAPRLYAAADFTLHEPLWQTPRLDFTTSQRIHVTR